MIESVRIEYNGDRCYQFHGLTLRYWLEVLEKLVNDPEVHNIRINRYLERE